MECVYLLTPGPRGHRVKDVIFRQGTGVVEHDLNGGFLSLDVANVTG